MQLRKILGGILPLAIDHVEPAQLKRGSWIDRSGICICIEAQGVFQVVGALGIPVVKLNTLHIGFEGSLRDLRRFLHNLVL